MKGQIFSMDALLALVAVAMIVGYSAWAFEAASSSARSLEYAKMKAMANDWAHIAVKRSLVGAEPNVAVQSALVAKSAAFDALMESTIPTAYSFEVSLGSYAVAARNSCAGKADVAVAARSVYYVADVSGESEARDLVVKVCV